jgi:hypothetical protein
MERQSFHLAIAWSSGEREKEGERVRKRESRVHYYETTSLYTHEELSLHTLLGLFSPHIRTHHIHSKCITTSLYTNEELSLRTLLGLFSPHIRTHHIHSKINTHAHADILDSTDYLTYLHTCVSVAANILKYFKRKMLLRTHKLTTHTQLTLNRIHFQVAVWPPSGHERKYVLTTWREELVHHDTALSGEWVCM